MGEDAAAKVLRHFSRDETQRVTKAMAKLSGIKSDSARNVIQNFFEDFRQHSGIRGASKEYLSNTLRKALGNDLAKGLLNNLYGDEIRNNMQRLQWVESETLARFITNEHPQMQAIFLAYLPPESSSEVLKFLPEDYHDELLFRIARLQDVARNQVGAKRHVLREDQHPGDFVAQFRQVARPVVSFEKGQRIGGKAAGELGVFRCGVAQVGVC